MGEWKEMHAALSLSLSVDNCARKIEWIKDKLARSGTVTAQLYLWLATRPKPHRVTSQQRSLVS